MRIYPWRRSQARVGFLIAILAGLALIVGPTASAATAPAHDQANGTAALGQFGDPRAHVNAVARPDGVSGTFEITYPDETFVAGDVVCVQASADIAYVTGQITESGGPRQIANNWQPGNCIVIGVLVKGEPGVRAGDPLNFSPGFAAHPGCGPNGAATPVFPIVSGNYQVVDGI
jgi:hypothetical protein